MARDNITLIPYSEDPLALLAQHILEDNSAQLPDLTQVNVLLSETHASKRLRHLLLQQAEQLGVKALLCPQVLTLRDWAKRQFTKDQKEQHSICGQYQRELILFDALTQHKALLGSGSPWHLTNDLLQLFDQLTSSQTSLPNNYDDFEKEIAKAYGLSADEFPALSHEATLVHTLWKAWHSQINAEANVPMFDNEAAYLMGLNADIKNNTNILYIAGYHQFSIAEQSWIKQLIEKQRCRLYLHGQQPHKNEINYHPDTPISKLLNIFDVKTVNKKFSNYTNFINNCYQYSELPFAQRAETISNYDHSEIENRLKLLFCGGHEEQAHAVELQVRRWILNGKENIGIVTENRRLARRVRALLERADIPLQDLAGWALSTTRAGAVLERLLECIEEDFAHQPFLDLLKSPYIFNELDTQQIKNAAYRLEHDIIRQENIARNLHSYKVKIETRAKKLNWSKHTNETLIGILNSFENAAKHLKPLLSGRHDANHYIIAITESFDLLGMTELLQKDAAGMRILELLETLKHSASLYSLKFNWTDFRTWLGRGLEKFVFTPEQSSSPVTLMGLGQSRLQQFDALIIASAEHEHMPGKSNITPFFNNSVRRQLNLSTSQELLTERFHHFRRLLESAPEVLITANSEENGEEVPLSPWLEIIQRFYEQAFSSSLEDTKLKYLATSPETFVIRCTEKSLPEKSKQAKISLPKALIPKRYSPSSYQTLMNCPYQFFVSRALNLSVNEEVQEALAKSDYGERVHRCLEAFHQEVVGLPEPFKDVITENNKEQAINHLKKISEHVFSKELEDNFENNGWLSQWLKLIPNYIVWQIKNAMEWQFLQAELKSNITWHKEYNLNGRLDRIDKNKDGLSIIDYKTGQSAKLNEIVQGEAVQLPFYALLSQKELNQHVKRVSYLTFDKEKGVFYSAQIENDDLDDISHKIDDRLEQLISEMEQGKALSAWGDENTCQYCNINRVCRKQAWKI